MDRVQKEQIKKDRTKIELNIRKPQYRNPDTAVFLLYRISVYFDTLIVTGNHEEFPVT